MKNLRKALAAVIALTVMSVSATAFAEVSATGAFSGGNGAVTADYSEIAQNKVKATVDTTLATTGTQMTFLVLDDGTDVTNIGESDILYIDQKELTAGGNTFTGVINLARVGGAAVDATELPAGSYPIRVGYYYDDNGEQTFGLAAATMVVTAGSEEPNTVKIVFGDVNGALYEGEAETNLSAVTAADALAILNLAIGGSPSVGGAYDIGAVLTVADGTKFVSGDVNGGAYVGEAATDLSAVTAADALAILNLAIGGSPSVGGLYDIGDVVSVVVED